MQIALNTVVSFNYRVATSEGEQVDESAPGQPLTYLHGHGQIVPGLEKALIGKVAGAVVDVEVTPEDGYGAYDTSLDLQVERGLFPADVHPRLKQGFQFHAEHPTAPGQNVMFTVHNVEGDNVFVSGNHPLAGKTLLFHVEIVEVRAATADELSHGHAHGPGGHHHH